MSEAPAPPDGLAAAGARLWTSVVADFELDEHETALLLAACRCADVLDALDEVLRRDGVMAETSQGRRAHPAAVESRQQGIALARLLAALRLPAGVDGDVQAGARPQRRVGARGVYGVQSVK